MSSFAAKLSESAKTSGTIAAGFSAAIAASVCCVGPLALVTLGLGGAWLAGLRALEAYFPVFIGIALIFFGFAFYRLYLRPAPCVADGTCVTKSGLRRQRIAFWTTLILAKALILFPLYAPYLFS